MCLPAAAATWQDEWNAIFSELGVEASLEQLDALVARQPELPDGSRLPLTSLTEARDLIAEAALPTKRQHKLALQEALREVEAENANLQAQYVAALPELQAASAEIAACKALVEKVSRARAPTARSRTRPSRRSLMARLPRSVWRWPSWAGCT